MGKGAILDEAFIAAAGLAEQLLTLAGPMENKHHPILQEAMFHIRTEEIEETVHLDRKYVFDNQVSIKASYGAGDKILCWLQRSLRKPSHDPKAGMVEVLMARELFLLGDWREFQRFKQFVKSMRILDAQARQWITDHHAQFGEMAQTADGLERILGCLEAVAEWPDLEGQDSTTSRTSLELIAKTYSRSLAPVRAAKGLPGALLKRAPDARFNIFRLFSFVEDPQGGPMSLVRFLAAMGEASAEPKVVEATHGLKNSRDISRAFAALRTFLLSRRLSLVGE
jgi:hypothetical protein